MEYTICWRDDPSKMCKSNVNVQIAPVKLWLLYYCELCSSFIGTTIITKCAAGSDDLFPVEISTYIVTLCCHFQYSHEVASLAQRFCGAIVSLTSKRFILTSAPQHRIDNDIQDVRVPVR